MMSDKVRWKVSQNRTFTQKEGLGPKTKSWFLSISSSAKLAVQQPYTAFFSFKHKFSASFLFLLVERLLYSHNPPIT
jgi:hypothetical protein